MPFINAAGYVAFRALASSSTKAGLPEAYAAPFMGRRPACDSASNGMCQNAADRNRLEMEEIVRRRNAQCEFHDALTNLKDRLASKATARTGAPTPADLYYRAS